MSGAAQDPIGVYKPYPDRELLISRHVNKIIQDRSGTLWFGTNDRICSYNGESLHYFGKAEGVHLTGVRDLIEDDKGNIWFCSQGSGVARYDGSSFTVFSEKDGLPDKHVWCVSKDKSGDLWFGTENGVCRYDGKTFVSFPLPAADLTGTPDVYPRPKQIWSIAKDKNGYLWFGTNGNGAYRYDGVSLVNFSEKDGLNSNIVFCVLGDNAGDVWFGTSKGMCRYNGKSFEKVNPIVALSEMDDAKPEVRAIAKDNSGDIWISILGKGVYRFDGKAFTHFDRDDGLSNYFITGIFQDRAGNYWFGGGEGLFMYDGNRFMKITQGGPWPKLK